MKWDKWQGPFSKKDDPEGKSAVMYSKYIINWKLSFWPYHIVVDIHKMVRSDPEQCYHSHPYNALRIPFWGGYIEEMPNGSQRTILPFLGLGIIRWNFAHRIHKLLNGRVSYSLWIRFKSMHNIEEIGEGWKTLRTSTIPSYNPHD